MMTKTVLFIGHSAKLDGAERCYLESVKALSLKGINVVALLPEKGPLCEKLDHIGIAYQFFEFPRWMKPTASGLIKKAKFAAWQWNLVKAFKQVLESVKPDLVITNTVVISPFAAVASKALGIPHYWYIHEFGDEDHGLQFILSPKMSGKIIDRYSECVFVNSKIIQEKFSKIIPIDKLKLLYYAVENDVEKPGSKEEAYNGQRPFNILLLGRMVKKKGQEEAVRGLSALKKKGYDVKLTLVGGGKQAFKEHLRTVAKELNVTDNLNIVDFTPNPMQYLADTDLVLMCSAKEAFGRVTVEAMKYGKMVVGGDVGASPEIINDGFNGKIYQHGNPEDLALKVAYCIDHPDERNKMAKNAEEWSLSNFNYNVHGTNFLKYLGVDQKEKLV